jgi:hypothetical protein
MTRALKIPVIASVAFTGIAFLVLLFLPRINTSREKVSYKDIDVAPHLQDGDIVCRLGDRLWSIYFSGISVTDKRFSHLGIVHIDSGAITVINAEGLAIEGRDFVNEVSLQEFLNVARAIGIYRLKNIEGSLVANTALDYKGRPFDWKFDLLEENTIYCSELLYAILKRISPGIHLKTVFQKEIGKEILPLESVSQSEYFEEVYYSKIKGASKNIVEKKKK